MRRLVWVDYDASAAWYKRGRHWQFGEEARSRTLCLYVALSREASK